MTKRYETRRLTEREQQLMVQVLIEQTEVQRWFAIVVSNVLDVELMIPIN